MSNSTFSLEDNSLVLPKGLMHTQLSLSKIEPWHIGTLFSPLSKLVHTDVGMYHVGIDVPIQLAEN